MPVTALRREVGAARKCEQMAREVGRRRKALREIDVEGIVRAAFGESGNHGDFVAGVKCGEERHGMRIGHRSAVEVLREGSSANDGSTSSSTRHFMATKNYVRSVARGSAQSGKARAIATPRAQRPISVKARIMSRIGERVSR